MIRSLIGATAMGVAIAAVGAVTPAPANADTTLTIATGRVLGETGLPVQGASLSLQAWPNNAVLAAANVGDSVTLVDVASVATDSNGNFNLVLPSIGQLADAALGDNIVDFTLTSTLPDGTTSHFSFSRRLVNTSVLGLNVIEAVVDPDLSQNAITNLITGLTSQIVQPLLGLVMTPDGTSTNDPSDTTSLPIGDQVPLDQAVPLADNYSCSSTVVQDFGQRTVQVNAAAAMYSGATTDFVYTNGATSTLGVAISDTGKYGDWKASGTVATESETTSTTTIGYPAESSGYFARKTNFRYKDFYVKCMNCANFSCVYNNYYETRPTNFVGGATTMNVGTPPTVYRTHCVKQEAGSSFTRDTSKAITWTNGVALEGPIGFDVSSRTGFSTTARNAFKFNTVGYICGYGDDPGASPLLLEAKKYLPAS